MFATLFVFLQEFPQALGEAQIILIGLVATAVIWVLRMVLEWFGWKPTLMWMGVIALAVSLVLALLFAGLDAFPPLPDDIVGKITVILNWAVGLVGYATLIYNIFLKKLLAQPTAKLRMLMPPRGKQITPLP